MRIENDWTKGHGFNERKKDENETNQKQRKNVTRERQYGIGKQKCPEDTRLCHLWLINYGERTSTSTFALDYPLLWPSCHV